MKKALVLFFASVFVVSISFESANAQKYEKSINKRMDQFFEAINSADWAGVVDMTYDKIFTMVTKEQMMQTFQQMDAMGMELKSVERKVETMSEPIVAEEKNFVVIAFASTETMKMTNEQYSSAQMVSSMKQQFNTIYGADNVSYDDSASTFTLTGDKVICAIAEKGSKDWQFMEYNSKNPMQKQMASNLLPASVIEKLDEFSK